MKTGACAALPLTTISLTSMPFRPGSRSCAGRTSPPQDRPGRSQALQADVEKAGFAFTARRSSPDGPHDKTVFASSIRGKADQFTSFFRKPAERALVVIRAHGIPDNIRNTAVP